MLETRSHNWGAIGLNLEEFVFAQPKTWENVYTSLETWVSHFVRGFLVKWGNGVPLIVTKNLPLKFGLKWSTLKFWVFRAPGLGFRLSPLEIEIYLEIKSHGFWKFSNFNWNPFEEMNKTQKSFRKQRSLVFQPILLQNWVFAKIEAKLNWNCASKLR